ncbi:MAG TPA: thioredoxin-like domain-containing protein [Pirellulales bacterium]|nr:thioredoxin-like domain-containing protein [Pirellulales bacterium]
MCQHRNRRVARGFLPAALLLALLSPGCRRTESTPALPALTSAGEVLERMVAAYHEADSYQDSGQVRLHFKKRGDGPNQEVNQDWDYSIAFTRPNKLRLHVYQSVVVCDGKELHAAVNLDEVRRQVLAVQAPDKLTPQNIFDSDPLLSQVLTQGGAAGPPLLLPLLLEEAALEPVLEGGEKPVLLPPDKVDGEDCYRVEVKRPDGRLVFWIDQKNFVLRRVEYPTDDFRKGVEEKEGPVTELSLTVECSGAKLDAKIEPAAFQFEAPEGSRLVQQFMVPPPLLGQRIGDFTFRGIDGNELTRESLAGKIVVFDFWATWCEPCLKSLPNLQRVADHYKDNDKLVFVAVSVDNDEVTDDAVREKFAEAKLSLPIARDPNVAARQPFLVESLPTMVIVGPDGVVQDYENVFDPELAESLPPKLEKLLAGENVYEETLRQYAEPAPSGSASNESVAVASLAERSKPEKLDMSVLWTCRELTSPGNVLAVDGAEQGRLLALDNWQTVVELDAEGQVVARHQLDLPKQPEEAVVSYLRTAVDAQGQRYFVGSANGVQQLFVFDNHWKRVLTYPKEGTHPGITDVQLADLDGDGALEIAIGFWGPNGVRCITPGGEQRWVNKSCENVLRLASLVGADATKLLATTAQGAVVPIDERGTSRKPLAADGRFIQLVFTADLDGDGASEICVIGPKKAAGEVQPGENVAMGLSAGGEVLWQYELPTGVPANGALEYVTSGQLLSKAGEWVIAGADGSIHILSADGQLVDRFNTGVALGGVAVAQLNGQAALIISSPEGVEARTLRQ